ncbi:MAG: L-seryl-tRNA(Sec) selenium transferase [Acidobacteria bacterium]|nr:L-seryl-tRNA(Sec) selenium transferase [Acidobacteriota bacterium]
MPEAANRPSPNPLSQLPSIDELLQSDILTNSIAEFGSVRVTKWARLAVDQLRSEMLSSPPSEPTGKSALADAAFGLIKVHQDAFARSLLSGVINATGVVIHTNLGRAPLSENAKKAIAETAAGYCTLEYDIATGKRGKRGRGAEELIASLTGAEAAVIVNNCASAAFLTLTALAAGREVVISRGELVEIGGDFRVPDVLARSGCVLKEVGTTNRTKLADYEKAVNENTAMLLRVHPSNYRIIGFTSTPGNEEMAALAKAKGVVFFEDAGSGALVDLSEFGLGDEPLISRSVTEGADLVAFSGDKLLGGPQSGLIVGRRELIDAIRRHPLYRALRPDKLTYAALEATLLAYERGTHFNEIPVLRMLSMSEEELAARAANSAEALQNRLPKDIAFDVDVIRGESAIGGGSAPGVHPETTLIALTGRGTSAEDIERRLRLGIPPVIARIAEDRLLIDLRTVRPEQESLVIDSIVGLA